MADNLKEELVAQLPDDRREGNPDLLGALKDYFEDKPERKFVHKGFDSEYNGRHAWPPYTEILLFKVDGDLYAVDGESDSWEGGWPMWQVDTVRKVKKTTKTIEVTEYERV